ncbi:MAG: hypothetical protein DMF67_09150 [Acidobacteria bacterium]|nr:MAG: hypothetical protein DMF67_09150 [Acidobacteriota bacterium]
MSTSPNRASPRAPLLALLPLLLLPASAARAQKAAPKSAPPSAARAAAPLAFAQYHARVGDCAATLEELAAFCEQLSKNEKPEVWTREGFDPDVALQLPKRERATFERVRGLLPPKEKVERAGGAVEVDNSWLYAALEEYKHVSNNDKRAQSLRSTAARLRALEGQLADTPPQDKDAERGRLNAILRDPEFNRNVQRGGALQRLVRDILDWIARHLPSGPGIEPGTNPRASQLAQLIVLALCLAVLSYVGWRVWSRRARGLRTLRLKRGPRVVLGERLEADQTPADLLDAAERLARAGDLRGAIRKSYIALLCELGDRGVVRLAQHRTNRDYLDAVRRSAAPRLYTEMMPLTFDFELHWYGFRDASDADWDDFRTRCRQALKAL